MFSHFLLFVSDCIFRSLGSSFYNQLLENFQKMFKCNFCSLTYASKSNRNRKRMSDHFAGCSERSGLKFFSSDSQIGAGGVTSYFLSERIPIIFYTIFNPSGICAYPGDRTITGLGVNFWNPHSFDTSTISTIDDYRISSRGVHTTISALVDSLLCK